jgi:hypothetical protein
VNMKQSGLDVPAFLGSNGNLTGPLPGVSLRLDIPRQVGATRSWPLARLHGPCGGEQGVAPDPAADKASPRDDAPDDLAPGPPGGPSAFERDGFLWSEEPA